jgi:serine/threonine-protein kinase
VLDDEQRLQPERALHITRQIADALGAAHAQRIVHRDLKPDNIMLVDREPEVDFVKVLDFGIAKVRVQDETGKTQQLTQLGTVFGTPEYMSPEQARGNPVDGRGDLYALGVMLYEMLAGTTPFKSDDLIVVLTRHITEQPPPLPADVPRPVSELVMKLLRKSPDERIQSARELVEAIDELIGPAKPPPSSLLRARTGSAADLAPPPSSAAGPPPLGQGGAPERCAAAAALGSGCHDAGR